MAFAEYITAVIRMCATNSFKVDNSKVSSAMNIVSNQQGTDTQSPG